MATVSEYVRRRAEEERKKQQKSQTSQTTQSQSKVSDYVRRRAEAEQKKLAQQSGTGSGLTTGATEQERTWFQKGALEGGVTAKSIFETILGTVRDAKEDLNAGALGMGEKFVDSLAALAPYAAQGMQNAMGGNPLLSPQELQTQQQMLQNNEALMGEFISKDLYDEQALAKQSKDISMLLLEGMGIKDADKASVLGEKSDALVQSAGQLGATAALTAVGVPAWLVTGSTSLGAEAENALKNGATMNEAVLSGVISAGAEVLTEKLSGGVKFGKMGTLDEGLTKLLARSISSKTGRVLAKMGMDIAGEGTEEVVSQIFSNLGSALYREEDLSQILASEEAFEEYLESFIGGAVLGGGGSAVQVVNANRSGKDAVSGFTANEQKVVDKVYKDRVAAEEKNGKVTQKRKTAIYDKVVADMDKGYISTDTIEEILGGETYKQYKTETDREAALRKEFDELGNTKNPTLKQQKRYAELDRQLQALDKEPAGTAAKEKLGKEVAEAVKGDRLAESYRERARKGEAFRADVTSYTGKARQIVQKAVDSGVLNNTNRSHELVDLIANIGADKDVDFDFANNEKLKESGFSIDGGTVNGLYSDQGITVNVESAKALNSVVGHEVAHVLEGSQLYDAMAEAVTKYAKSKGEYDSRLQKLTEVYQQLDSYRGEGAEQKIQKELVADLVGDYLFTDKDFVERLSTEDRNVFQKIYDEVKYLCRVATAGTEEARQLEKVKKIFEDAYRKAQKSPTGEGGVRYSLSDGTTKDASELSKSDLQYLLESAQNGELSDNSYIPLRRNTPEFFTEVIKEHSKGSVVIENYPMAATVEHLRQNMDEEDGQSYGDARPHGFSTDDIITMSEKMGDPSYIVLQKNGRYAEVVSFYNGQNKQVVVAIDLADSSSAKPKNYKYTQYMNGYGGGYYNIIVTQYEPDSLAKYLNDCEVIYSKKEMNGRYQVGSGRVVTVTHDTPFIKDSIRNPDEKVNTKTSLSANGVAQPDGGWQIMGEDVARKDVPILDQLAEELAAKMQAKGQNADISVLEQLIEERIQAEQTELDEEYRRQVENPDEASKTAGQRSNVADKPITTVKQRLERKLRNLNTELENNQRHRQEANQAYTEQIAAAQKAYDGKPHKESKAAQKLLRRIQRLTRLQADADAEYEKRIHDIEKRIEKVNDQLLDDYTEQDRLNAINQRIDRQLEAEIEDTKKRYRDRFNKEKANLGNRIQFIKRNATTLYNEITGRKKGDRLSRNLSYLLDLGYDWQELQVAAARVNQSPTLPVQKESSAENAVRELFGGQFEERSLDLEEGMVKQFNDEIEDLQKKAAQKKEEAKISEQRRQKQDTYEQEVAELVGDTSTWVDKKVGISYQTNTLRRNLRDVVRDEKGNKDIAKADALYEYLQGDYNRNEAEMNREIDRVKRPYADLKITKEESVYIQMLGEFRHNPDTELMPDMVEEYYEAHKKKIDKEKVDRVIEMARKTYDDLLKRVNAVLREQGMKEIPYREGYFPHFTEDKQSWLAKLLNWKTQNNDIPTDIAGITEQFNPNRSWQPFNKERTSDTTDYNFLKGMDNYVRGAMDWIYHLEDIQRNRAFENHLRYVHSDAGIQERIDAIRDDTAFDAEEAQKQMESVWNEAKNPLGNLVQDLRTRTNLLAGKKHSADRGVEAAINRKVYSTMTNISSRVSANMVAGSVSSALTNFIPITQSWGQVSPEYSLNAMGDTIRSYISDDGTIERSAFLTNRLKKADTLYKTGWDKASNVVGLMMEAVDNFTSQTVWRSKYLQNISEGMIEAQAIRDADQFAENVIAGRSRGNMPTIFESKNPITRVFTAFQLEVANQYGYMFKDMPNDAKNQSMARLLKGYAAMYMGAYAYNALYSSLVGRDAAFDPIGIIEELLGDLGFGDDEEEEEPADVILNLADNVLEEVPFVGGLLGGGRIPISSALPYDGIYEAFQGTVQDVADGNWKNLTWEWMNPAFYLVSPMMGGQIRKSAQGIGMFLGDKPVSGSYTDSGKLRFPVQEDAKSVFQAAIFGQWASKTAQEYFDEKRTPLTQEQIDEFLKVDIPIHDYWEYREGLKGLEKLSEKGDYIASLDLPVEKKNILINNIAKRDEPIDMSTYDQYPNFEEFDYGTKHPGRYAISQAVGGYKTYKGYQEALGKIEADKDKDGKTVADSRKEKVLTYINGLDAEYGEKIILYKSEYPGDDRYNYQILDYLNGREDITRAQMVQILTELGFTVHANGTVTW